MFASVLQLFRNEISTPKHEPVHYFTPLLVDNVTPVDGARSGGLYTEKMGRPTPQAAGRLKAEEIHLQKSKIIDHTIFVGFRG